MTKKRSNLINEDLIKFNITLKKAKELGIMKEDLVGVYEIIPDKKYRVQVTFGRRKSKRINGTLLDAIEIKNEMEDVERKYIEEFKSPLSNENFISALKKFMQHLLSRTELPVKHKRHLDLNTYYDYKKKFNSYVCDFFKNYTLSQINNILINEWLEVLRNRPKKTKPDELLSEKTIDHALTYLSAFFSWCKKEQVIEHNPCNRGKLENPPNPEKAKVKYLDEYEMENVRTVLDKYASIRLKTAISLILDIGCRREEIVGVRWQDINFENKTLNFLNAITCSIPAYELEGLWIREKALKSKKSYREIGIEDSTLESLLLYRKYKEALGYEVTDTDFIFTNWDTNEIMSPEYLTRDWKIFRDQHNIPDVHLHGLRHSLATFLRELGYSKKDIAYFLGHSEKVLEEIYSHSGVEQTRQLSKAIKTRFNNEESKFFSINSIVSVILEEVYPDSKKEIFNLLDFISGESVPYNDLDIIALECKNYLIDKYPFLDEFNDKSLLDKSELLEAKKAMFISMINNNEFKITVNRNELNNKKKLNSI